MVFSSQKLWHYLLTHKVKLIAKIDPLKYLLSKPTLTGRLTKWVMILSEFDIEYVDHKAIKDQVIANQLADSPLEGFYPIEVDFLDAHILQLEPVTWKLYFNGSYTHHGSGAKILFITP